jgi:hypothetical protein
MFFSDAVVSINTLDSWACGDTHFKNKIKTFNAYTLPKVHQLDGIARHTWHIV